MPIDTGNDTLVTADDLAGFEGAPFDAAVVLAVGAAIRGFAGWHIAPAREAAVAHVESAGGRSLFLPTLGLYGVTQVLDVTEDPDQGTVVTGYRTHETTRFRAGVVDCPTGWPIGVLAVTFDHGFDTCPKQLLPVVAEVCRAIKRGGLSQRSLGDKSESWRDGLSPTSSSALAQFKIPRSR